MAERAASGAAPLVVAPAAGPAGMDRPPTPAMKSYVFSLARQKGLKPPRGYAKSGGICRASLDQHVPPQEHRRRRGTRRSLGNTGADAS